MVQLTEVSQLQNDRPLINGTIYILVFYLVNFVYSLNLVAVRDVLLVQWDKFIGENEHDFCLTVEFIK